MWNSRAVTQNSQARRLRDEGKYDDAIAMFNEIIETGDADEEYDQLAAREGLVSTYAMIG